MMLNIDVKTTSIFKTNSTISGVPNCPFVAVLIPDISEEHFYDKVSWYFGDRNEPEIRDHQVPSVFFLIYSKH